MMQPGRILAARPPDQSLGVDPVPGTDRPKTSASSPGLLHNFVKLCNIIAFRQNSLNCLHQLLHIFLRRFLHILFHNLLHNFGMMINYLRNLRIILKE